MQTRVSLIYHQTKLNSSGDHWIRRSAALWNSPQVDIHDASEYGVLEDVQTIAGFLSEAGHAVSLFAVEDIAELADYLRREKPDVIFNCCESFRGNAALEMNLAALVELFDIPCTGSSSLTLGLALNKGIAKAIFQANGIPTPPYVILRTNGKLDGALNLRPPWIVKPIAEDAALGIDGNAVLADEAALARRVRFILEEFRQPALVEEYIEGRELNVSLLASSPDEFITLPISEIDFEGLPQGSPRILSYEAKWLVDSAIYRATKPRCPALLDSVVAERVRALAIKAVRVLGLRDYGRIDFRLREDNSIFVLEANPNPDITHDSGFVRAAQATGRTHADTVREILEQALRRSRKPE